MPDRETVAVRLQLPQLGRGPRSASTDTTSGARSSRIRTRKLVDAVP